MFQHDRLGRGQASKAVRCLFVGMTTFLTCAAGAAAQEKPQSTGVSSEVIEVVVDGEGLDKDQALKAALRAALEMAGKQEIFSDTKVENYQLVHDTIISRALGIVTDFKILSEKQIVGGTWKVQIRARVSKSVLKENWGAVQNVLNQIGRPKIMVWINERIEGRLEEQSLLETRIEEKLLKSGFDLVSRKAVQADRQKQMADATAQGRTDRLQALAREHEAHLFIAGTANADRAGVENLYGVPVVFYNCDAQIKTYYTDSGKILASAALPNTRGGARGRKEFSPQAGKQALALAAEPLVENLYGQVMKQWATQISAGGELLLEVGGLEFKSAARLKKAIAELKDVNQVNMKFDKVLSRFRINARMSAEDLAGRLCEGEFEKLLEIESVELNRIQAKSAGQ